jgi:L-lactate utilization protein LutC
MDARLRARRFAEALEAVGGRVLWAPDRSEARRLLAKELSQSSQPIVLHSCEPLVVGLMGVVRSDLARATIVGWEPAEVQDPNGRSWLRTRAAGASVGVTGCDALIAETGTVVLVASAARPRSISLLPPRHVVLATTDLLVADLEEWVARRALVESPDSAVTFVTGPSRTADIEKVLVTGMHGPKELTVVLMGNR